MPVRVVQWDKLAEDVGRRMKQRVQLAQQAAFLAAQTKAREIIRQNIDNFRPSRGSRSGMVSPPVDTGSYKRGWKVSRTRRGARIYNDQRHAVFVEDGRQPNSTMPPWKDPNAGIGLWVRRVILPRAIVEWESRTSQKARKKPLKHVSERALETKPRWFRIWRSLSFVVARSIAKKGIEPRRVLARSEDAIVAAWVEMFEELLRKEGAAPPGSGS